MLLNLGGSDPEDPTEVPRTSIFQVPRRSFTALDDLRKQPPLACLKGHFLQRRNSLFLTALGHKQVVVEVATDGVDGHAELFETRSDNGHEADSVKARMNVESDSTAGKGVGQTVVNGGLALRNNGQAFALPKRHERVESSGEPRGWRQGEENVGEGIEERAEELDELLEGGGHGVGGRAVAEQQ